MSHVDFKKGPYPMLLNSPCYMSPLRHTSVACRFQEMAHVVSLILILMSLGSMSHFDFKKCPCRCVEFRSREPYKQQRTFPMFL